jgi:phosphoribosylformylglycinamidine (FGAM) synthase-like enzyme
LADPSWVYSQYDHQLFLNTGEGPGGDAAVLRLKHPTTGADTGRGMALTTDGNHRWCAVDPRQGTAMTVAESVLNLACVGAYPIALVNCLNFGNPEHPEVMWQLSEAVDGMTEACGAFAIPVVGGNVSLYNESAGTDIDPTPVIGLLGLVDDLSAPPPGVTLSDGGRIMVLGDTDPTLGGSDWARRQGHGGAGPLPGFDLPAVSRVAGLVRDIVADGIPSGVHDVSQGGLGQAVAEMACRAGVGVTMARIADHATLFTESAGRVVLCVPPEAVTEVEDRAGLAGVAATRMGVAMGDRITIKGLLDLDLADVVAAWRGRLPDALGAGADV